MIINTIIFLVATQLVYYSILGYGSLLKKDTLKDIWLENFLNFTVGIIILNLIGFFCYYLEFNSNYLNIFLLLIGLCFFDLKKNRTIFKKQILVNVLFFSSLLISKLHEDWPYHFNFIEQISIHSPLIGIGNVDDIHMLSTSFFSFVQKIFFLPFFEFKLILIPTYLIYLNLIIFLIHIILENKNQLSLIFILILTILIIKFSRISEFGYDYLSNFILLKILILFLIKQNDLKINISFNNIYILFFLYSITIKISALFFTPILVYLVYEDFDKKKIIFKDGYNYLFLILCCFFLIENFLKSGCFLYFIENTCLNKDLVSWSIDYYRVSNHANHVELWAKGFYVQESINDSASYLNIKNWFPIWVKNHFFYKIFEFILIPILFLIYVVISKTFVIRNKKYYKFLFASIISILLWFNFLPQLRFGSTILIVFFIAFMMIFLDKNILIKFDNKKYIIVFILLVLIFNFKNIDRIKNEFKREDVHKFTNYPFPPEKRILSSINSANTIKFLPYKGRKIKKFKWFNVIN